MIRILFCVFLSGSLFSQAQPNIDAFVVQSKSVVLIQSIDFNGQFSVTQGRIVLNSNTKKVTGFDLVIDVSSLDLNIPGMTKHAKSADFFDVATYPTITFFSDSIVENDGVLSACGVMTSKGVALKKNIPFELVSLENTRLSVHATFKILRSEFTIGEEDAVSDEVQIEATLFAKKNKE